MGGGPAADRLPGDYGELVETCADLLRPEAEPTALAPARQALAAVRQAMAAVRQAMAAVRQAMAAVRQAMAVAPADDNGDRERFSGLLWTLIRLGQPAEAVSVILPMLSDPDVDIRPLWLLSAAGPAAAPALPKLRQIVEGDDSSLGVAALHALWSITGDPEETVDHCRRMLPQVGPSGLANVFSEMGSHAEPFADDVRAAFDEDSWLLPVAHWRITSDLDASLPELITHWRRRGAYSDIVRCWAEMGAAASERTAPLLRAELATAERATYSGMSDAVEADEEFLAEVRDALAVITAPAAPGGSCRSLTFAGRDTPVSDRRRVE